MPHGRIGFSRPRPPGEVSRGLGGRGWISASELEVSWENGWIVIENTVHGCETLHRLVTIGIPMKHRK